MFEGKPITDEDMTNIGINCGLAFGFDANNSGVRPLAINSVAHARSYDSLQNFLHTPSTSSTPGCGEI